MATLYFNGAGDNEWTTLENWWQDEACTIAATALPGSEDTVYIITLDSVVDDVAPRTVANFYAVGCLVAVNLTVPGVAEFSANAFGGASFSSGFTLTGSATFVGGSGNGGTITANATFDGGTNNGTVGGNATLNNYSTNTGVIVGDATLIDSTNSGTISGNATLSGSSTNAGTISQNATFNNSSQNGNPYVATGTVTGNATFNDSSYNQYEGQITGYATFNNSATNNGACVGGATFNDYSYNTAAASSNNGISIAIFNGSSANAGYVYGNATFNDSSANVNGSTVNGPAVFNDYSSCNQYADSSVTLNDYASATDTCSYGNVITANDYSIIHYSSYGSPSQANFYDHSTHGNGWVSSNNILNDNAFANGQGSLYGDSFTLNDNSYGIINGTYQFQLNGNPVILPQGVYYNAGYFGLEIVRRSGINGSSVLGVI